MIGQLNGEIIERSPTELIVDCGGVGYEVKISLNTFSARFRRRIKHDYSQSLLLEKMLKFFMDLQRKLNVKCLTI